MQRFLYHDLIVAGNWCNLKCSYCTSVADAGDYGTETSASGRRRGATIAIDDVLAMVDGMRRHIDAPVMKVSGGELFLLANAADLVAELSSRYAHVQVLTNGTEITPEIVRRLARLGNVGFNLSLDGHTPAMNAMRWRSAHLGERVMAAFAEIAGGSERLEITSVVSDANAETFPAFLEFLSRQSCRIVAMPIPVRGRHAEMLFQDRSRMRFAQALRDMPQAVPEVLGPAAYYHALADFLDRDGSRRRRRCHLANAAIQLFDTGAVTPCPVGWTAEIGNIRTDGIERVMGEVGAHKMYDLLTREPPRVPVCRNCFSQADVVTLFVEGEVTLAEIGRMPMYGTAAAKARLAQLRATLGGGRVPIETAAPQVAAAAL